MKVLHVSESLIGGPASYLEEILPEQERRYGSDNIAVLIPEQHRRHLLQTFQGKVYSFYRAKRGLRANLALWRSLKLALSTFGADIVHLHSSFAGLIGRLAIRRRPNDPKIIYCAHCWYFDRERNSLAKTLAIHIERSLAKRADAIVNISPHEIPLLKRHGFDSGNAVTVISGIKGHPELMQDAGGLEFGNPVKLLFVGRFDRQKGLDLLLKSLPMGIARSVSLTIVGAPVVGGNLSTTSHEGVEWRPWVPRADIPALIREHHFVVMPSRWEGLPLAALECLRAGRPLIANDIPTLRDIVGGKDGLGAGIIIDFENPTALVAALIAVDSTKWTKMCASAVDRYESDYRADKMNYQMLMLYDRLLGSRQPSLDNAAYDFHAAVGADASDTTELI